MNFDLENNQLVPYNEVAEDFLDSIYGLDIFYNTYWERSCKDITPNALLNLYNTVNSVNDDYLYNLNQSYLLRCEDNVSDEIISILKDNIAIESVYTEPKVEVCAIPNYSGTQIYLDTESGLNIREAWNYSTGENVKVGVIEFGFNKNHIELSNVNIGVDFPTNWDTVSNTHHGTASLGVIGSINNGFGTIGIAYNSDIWFSSIYNGVANALLYLISNCGFTLGDVISMSISYGSAGTIEYDRSTYNAIKYATLLGITVCMSAGNNSLNLANLSTYNSSPSSNPNLPQNDSGSIIVGGGTTTRSAFSYSNYGERVNVQGLGTSVVTSGYGDLYSIDGENSYYTRTFGGTSSACPTVAGGVALIQSYRKSLGLQPFNAYEIRNLFELINYPQTGDLTRHIGGMPNICGIITSVGMSNISPIAIEDTAQTLENNFCNINVLQNDNDTDGNVVELIKVTHGQYGSTEINLDKTIKYTPNSNYAGSDSFKYLISDDNVGVSIGTVNVTVVPVNSNPVAVNDNITTHKNIPIDILVLSNDTDVDGDALILLSVTQGTNGTTSINPNNSVRYIPNTNYVGQDTFEYTISDGNGGTDTATVTISIINTLPVALNNSANTTINIPINIDVLTNDSDFNNDPLTIIGVTQGLHGDVIINQNQTVKYSPHNNYLGIDTFSYTISDGSGGTSSANVTVSIGAQINNIDNNPLEENNQPEQGGVIMAKKYVQEKQLKTGSITEYRQMYDSQRAATNFVIAPADAVNKEGADLILTGVPADDLAAINNAIEDLHIVRNDTTVAIRIDFLGGNIDLGIKTDGDGIVIPVGYNNIHLYGNGVKIIGEIYDSNYTEAYSILKNSANGVIIDGFEIVNSANVGLYNIGTNCTITGNTCSGDISLDNIGISCIINGNTCYGSNVSLYNVGINCTIISNICNGGNAGLYNTGNRCTISGNICSGVNENGLHNVGISCIISGNTCSGVMIGLNNVGISCTISGNTCSGDFGIDLYNAITSKRLSNTVQSGSTTTAVKLNVGASNTTDYYKDMYLIISGEERIITAYDGSTKVATLASALSNAPTVETSFIVTYKSNIIGNSCIIGGISILNGSSLPSTSSDLAKLNIGTITIS